MHSILLRGAIALGLTTAAAATGLTPVSGQPLTMIPSPSHQLATSLSAEAGGAEPVEVVAARTRTSKTFWYPDGTHQTELYTAPIHFQTTPSEWEPIHNTLVDTDRTDYAVENAANEYQLFIPSDVGETPVRFQSGGQWLSFASSEFDGAPVVAGPEASFNASTPADNTSLNYTATSTGVKETIVLSEPPTEDARWSFDIDGSAGLEANLTPDGGVHFKDQSGTTAFHIPPPFMTDSSDSDSSYSSAVSFDLFRDDTGWRLDVVADESWLHDPSRVYPIMIDPTITTDPPVKDCYISAQSPNVSNCGPGSPYLRVGVGGGDPRRSLLKFYVSAVPSDASIDDAQLELYMDATQSTTLNGTEYVARRMTHGWTGDATWNTHNGVNAWTKPGGDFAARSYAGTGINGSTSGYKSLDVTPMVSTWVNGSELNSGLVVKQAAEDTNNVLYFISSDSTAQAHWPKLTVTYSGSESELTNVDVPAGQTDCIERAAQIATGLWTCLGNRLAYEESAADGSGTVWKEETIPLPPGDTEGDNPPSEAWETDTLTMDDATFAAAARDEYDTWCENRGICNRLVSDYIATVKGNAFVGKFRNGEFEIWATWDVVWRQAFDGPYARWRLYLKHDKGSAVDSEYWRATEVEENTFADDNFCSAVMTPAVISRLHKTDWSPSRRTYEYCGDRVTKDETWHDDLMGVVYVRGDRWRMPDLHTGHWRSFIPESGPPYRLKYTRKWYE